MKVIIDEVLLDGVKSMVGRVFVESPESGLEQGSSARNEGPGVRFWRRVVSYSRPEDRYCENGLYVEGRTQCHALCDVSHIDPLVQS